jgi:hypothetical protein
MQAKRLTIEYAVLPLASELVHENAPYVRTLLLHGGQKTGKTLLVCYTKFGIFSVILL